MTLNAAARRYYLGKTGPHSQRLLEDLLITIEETFSPPPENVCHWCGKTDSENEDDGYGPCVDITVTMANGEEGYAQVVRHACDEHLQSTAERLIELGFGLHAHGGACFLEPKDCPGARLMADCPAPEPQYPE